MTSPHHPRQAGSDRPPLVIAHGLFGSARNWGAIARRLALHRQVVAVDMRNHGDSPRSPDHGYEALAGDLAETIAAHRRPRRPARPLHGRQGRDGAGADRARPRPPAGRRRHGARRLRATARSNMSARCRRSISPPSPAVPTPTRRSRPRCPTPACAPSSSRASRSTRTAPPGSSISPRSATQMPRIMGFPDLAAPLPRADALPDRRRLGLCPAGALAPHPRLFPAAAPSRDPRRRPLAARRRPRRLPRRGDRLPRRRPKLTLDAPLSRC